IPVVGNELTDDLGDKFRLMTKYSDYNNLIDNLNLLTEKYGFQFLNSKQCEELFEKMRTLEKVILKNSNDEVLFRISQKVDEIVDIYENDIIRNIYLYSAENEYNKALMFIGSAHRNSI